MGLLDRISFKNRTVEPPEAIDVTPENAIRILWPGGPEVTVPAVRMRDYCGCASCIEEGTGRKLLDPASIPADIRPLAISAVGSYAIKFDWSDGHSTGIYTWEILRKACAME